MKSLLLLLSLIIFSSCATKKDVHYLQESKSYPETEINYQYATLQPNDVLQIIVSTLIMESAMPYNFQQPMPNGGGNQGAANLMGYVVNEDYTINFPVLGYISVKGKTPLQLEQGITNMLIDGGHLKQPTVNVRLINAKFTILGGVGGGGTVTYTEPLLNIFQALGMAGDLAITGERNGVKLMREVDGKRVITHLDLRSTDITNSPYYYIKPNDVIIVNQNGPEVKRAGYITNIGGLFGLVSFGLTMLLLLQN